jgi:hypothetical protein
MEKAQCLPSILNPGNVFLSAGLVDGPSDCPCWDGVVQDTPKQATTTNVHKRPPTAVCFCLHPWHVDVVIVIGPSKGSYFRGVGNPTPNVLPIGAYRERPCVCVCPWGSGTRGDGPAATSTDLLTPLRAG